MQGSCAPEARGTSWECPVWTGDVAFLAPIARISKLCTLCGQHSPRTRGDCPKWGESERRPRRGEQLAGRCNFYIFYSLLSRLSSLFASRTHTTREERVERALAGQILCHRMIGGHGKEVSQFFRYLCARNRTYVGVPSSSHSPYQRAARTAKRGISRAMTGEYISAAVSRDSWPFRTAQHAGLKLATYSTGNPMTPASIHFAHRSRRFTIRTVSQTQNAANAMARMVGVIVYCPKVWLPVLAFSRDYCNQSST